MSRCPRASRQHSDSLICCSLPSEIRPDVVDVLQAHRDPDKVVGDPCVRTLGVAESTVGGGRRVHNGGLGVTQVRRQREHAGPVDTAPGLGLPALDPESQHAAEGALLGPGQLVTRVILKPRIEHALHCGLLFQPTGEFEGIGTVRLHAQPQGFQTLEKHPGIEGAHGRTRRTQKSQHLVHMFTGTHHCATHASPLPVQVLGGGMGDDIRPKGQRRLQRRCAETVVHHQQRADIPRQGRQSTKVCDFRQRV